MKTLITSSHCTRTDYIEFQYKTFKKFIKGNYDFIVFNDASESGNLNNFNNNNIRNEIKNKCSELEIKCIDIPQYLHSNRKIIFPDTQAPEDNHVSARGALVTQYMYNYAFESDYDRLILLDSDMFLIEELDLDNLNNFDIGFISQGRYSEQKVHIEYMWIGILIINFKNLRGLDKIYFDCGKIYDTPVDSGGFSYYWLEKYRNNVTIKYINCLRIEDNNSYENEKNTFSNELKEYFEKFIEINCNRIAKELILDRKIFHVSGGGCNWDYTNHPFKNYLISKYNNTQLDNVWLLGHDLLSTEWSNFQYKLSSVMYDMLNNLINN